MCNSVFPLAGVHREEDDGIQGLSMVFSGAGAGAGIWIFSGRYEMELKNIFDCLLVNDNDSHYH